MVKIIHGEALEQLRALPDNSVDSIITDPPYEIAFMGNKWDDSGIAYSVDLWSECLRVMKPGGHLLAFGGARTGHRLASAIEDAGFQLRDSIAWIYGSGFPKSQNVSKAIDKAAGAERKIIGREQNWDASKAEDGKQAYGDYAGSSDITEPATDAARLWDGWGTALKPAFEPIAVARKPFSGTVAANVQQWGTGALNIDRCRVESEDAYQAVKPDAGSGMFLMDGFSTLIELEKAAAEGRKCPDGRDAQTTLDRFVTRHERNADWKQPPPGRWPPNVTIDDEAAVRLGDAAKYFPVFAREFPCADEVPRFRYQAKAPKSERPQVDGVSHPTVKPLALIRWLVKLVTAPGGVVLDPFLGSGTTAQAAELEGMDCIGIEREAAYIALIEQRLGLDTVGSDGSEN